MHHSFASDIINQPSGEHHITLSNTNTTTNTNTNANTNTNTNINTNKYCNTLCYIYRHMLSICITFPWIVLLPVPCCMHFLLHKVCIGVLYSVQCMYYSVCTQCTFQDQIALLLGSMHCKLQYGVSCSCSPSLIALYASATRLLCFAHPRSSIHLMQTNTIIIIIIIIIIITITIMMRSPQPKPSPTL